MPAACLTDRAKSVQKVFNCSAMAVCQPSPIGTGGPQGDSPLMLKPIASVSCALGEAGTFRSWPLRWREGPRASRNERPSGSDVLEIHAASLPCMLSQTEGQFAYIRRERCREDFL